MKRSLQSVDNIHVHATKKNLELLAEAEELYIKEPYIIN